MTGNSQELRVASPIETQHATFTPESATDSATPNATGSLKALANAALRRLEAQPATQPRRNLGQKQAQLSSAIQTSKVAPHSGITNQNETPEDIGKCRLEKLAIEFSHPITDLVDWYAEDLADLGTLPEFSVRWIVIDYIDHASTYRRLVSGKQDTHGSLQKTEVTK